MHTITCIIRDNYQGNHDPLIYAVTVDTLDHDTVLAAVNIERMKDLGGPDELDLDLLFAFQGDLNTVADWRE